MSLTFTETTLLPVRRDKQIGTAYTSGGGLATGGGGGSVPVSAHSLLTQLDYASAGHTGFASIDSPVFTTQITTPLIYGGSAANGDITIRGTSDGTKTTSYVILQDTGGNVGVATVTPLGKFTINAPDDSICAALLITQDNNENYGFGWYIDQETGHMGLDRWTVGARGSNIITVTDDYLVGIGTTSPVTKLQVYGTETGANWAGRGVFGGASYAVVAGQFNDKAYLGAHNAALNAWADLAINPGGGNVGIRTDAPTVSLEVAGTGIKSEIVQSVTAFETGFFGQGYKVIETGGTSSLEVDSLRVRGTLYAYELEINKITSVNGGLMISVANGTSYDYGYTIGEFTSWTNLSYEAFISSGLNISSCINTGGGAALVYITQHYHAALGETITIIGTIVLNSGALPVLRISEDAGTITTNYALAAGANTINHVITDAGVCEIDLYANAAADCNFSMTGVTVTSDILRIFFDTSNLANPIQFKVDDFIIAQNWTGVSGEVITQYKGLVTDVVQGGAALGSAYIEVTTLGGSPWDKMDLVQMGSSDTDRQSLIYLTAHDTNNPYIDGYSGVAQDGDVTGHRKFRLGNLTGVTDALLGALSGYGLWSDNVYLTGKLVLPNAGMTNEGSAASSVRIYAGDTYANRATADFNVTQDGTLSAIGTCTLGSATGQVNLGLTGSRGAVEVYSTIKYYGGIKHWGYNVQNDIELHDIEYNLYYLDAADVAKTLWLPATSDMVDDAESVIILLNPTKANFTIDGNGEDIYLNTSVPVSSFVLSWGESATLYYSAAPYPGWYELS